MKSYLQQIGRFLLVLLAVQIARGLLVTGLWRLLQPAADSPLWAYMDTLAFGLVGISLLFIFRPSAADLALEWGTAFRLEKITYASLGVLTLGMVASTYFFEPDVFARTMNVALVIPVFEELLFRGWGWTKLARSAAFPAAGFTSWLVMSLLFAFWQFGYMDIYLLRIAPANPGMDSQLFILTQFGIALIIGLIAGLPRWRTRHVYGSLIVHSLINLFGR